MQNDIYIITEEIMAYLLLTMTAQVKHIKKDILKNLKLANVLKAIAVIMDAPYIFGWMPPSHRFTGGPRMI